jgi:hypothetical protein
MLVADRAQRPEVAGWPPIDAAAEATRMAHFIQILIATEISAFCPNFYWEKWAAEKAEETDGG